MTPVRIVHGENLAVLAALPDGCVDLAYVDPPFNTGVAQTMRRIRATPAAGGAGTAGFGGRAYDREVVSTLSYDDVHEDYLGSIEARAREIHRVLAPGGSLFFHIDPRESHYCKVLLDGVFGRSSFRNEIIWSYDYGARSRRHWPTKHDTIFWYARDPANYTFDFDAIDRIPYMAPSLVGAEKAARGKTPTDVWWNTIVPTNGSERTGYPTQKPLSILERIVVVHSRPGDLVLDCYAGSGTTGEAAARHGRDVLLVDANPQAIDVMAARLAPYAATVETVEEFVAAPVRARGPVDVVS